jgi:putative hydrolase of the HAD superfamily
MIKALVFDCFGVLYPDTYWTIASSYLGANYSGREQELHDLVKRADLGHITRDDLWAEFSVIIGKSKTDVYEELKEMGGLDQKLLNFIESKKASFKIGMISNVGHGFLESMFADKPAPYYFDSIVLSSDVGLVKPDRRIYEYAARDLQLELSQCLFTDDLQKNVDGAEQAGMKAILYKNFDQYRSDIEQLLLTSDANN